MRRVVAAIVLLAAFVVLGAYVSARPPAPFDAGELGAFGSVTAFATFARAAGQFPPYAVLCAMALVAGLVRRAYLPAASWLIVSMLAVWKTSDTFKDLFHRPRPEHWLVAHETSASYPSGHADLSLAFYGFAAYVAWGSPWPAAARGAIVALCAAWILSMGWSRLALGAHFPTDVLGGYLLGGTGLCLATLMYDRTRGRVRERAPARTSSRYTR